MASTTPVGNHLLGGVALPANIRWLDRRQVAGTAQQVRYALSGIAVHVYAQPQTVGRKITLDISREFGWLYTDKYTQLLALESPGSLLTLRWVDVDEDTLVHTNNDYTVVLDYSSGPALDFTHIDRVGSITERRIDRGRYEGQIHLLTV